MIEPDFYQISDDGSVISFKTGTFKLNDLEAMQQKVGKEQTCLIADKIAKQGKGGIPQGGLFDQGVDAELLEPARGEWVKGKVRLKIVLEFRSLTPEEEMINQMEVHEPFRETAEYNWLT